MPAHDGGVDANALALSYTAAMRLLAHPQTPPGPVRQIEAEATLDPDGQLHLRWRLEAAMALVRLPAPVVPSPADELWQHSCFEAFIRTAGAAGYCELNFAPSGAWAAYRFAGYRAGMQPLGLQTPPKTRWQQSDSRLELAVTLPLPGLMPEVQGSSLRLGMAAVVEEATGAHSYWALRHPAGRPDFHHLDGFALTLASQAMSAGSAAS